MIEVRPRTPTAQRHATGGPLGPARAVVTGLLAAVALAFAVLAPSTCTLLERDAVQRAAAAADVATLQQGTGSPIATGASARAPACAVGAAADAAVDVPAAPATAPAGDREAQLWLGRPAATAEPAPHPARPAGAPSDRGSGGGGVSILALGISRT